MDSILLDTNIVSYLEKNDSRVEGYRRHLEGKRHVICFMTVADFIDGPFNTVGVNCV